MKYRLIFQWIFPSSVVHSLLGFRPCLATASSRVQLPSQGLEGFTKNADSLVVVESLNYAYQILLVQFGSVLFSARMRAVVSPWA